LWLGGKEKIMRDHGGNIDWAVQHFGARPEQWIDLSTGINRCPYPVPSIPAEHWQALPTMAALDALHRAAQEAYHTKAPILAIAGAQTAIQLIPHMSVPSEARVLAPTYNEHAAALRACGWRVREVEQLHDLRGADLAVVVNPNNPDGRRHDPSALAGVLGAVGRLVVDESFADTDPDISIASWAGRTGLLVLRSIGKFYGLAGLRLGFVLGCKDDIEKLTQLAGPWPVSGPAIHIGRCALQDAKWAAATTLRLKGDADRLDRLVTRSAWKLAGGTPLFRLYMTEDSRSAQDRLGQMHIWSRIFPWSPHLVRLGLPGSEPEWDRVTSAFAGVV
jgi:cobalamin biosynthetic protein CobC